MECLFVIIITKLYKTCLAAIKFQFARIYFFSKYAPYWEWEHFSVKWNNQTLNKSFRGNRGGDARPIRTLRTKRNDNRL